MILLLQQNWQKATCLLANVVKLRKAKDRTYKYGKTPQMQSNGWQTWNSQGRKQESEKIVKELWKTSDTELLKPDEKQNDVAQSKAAAMLKASMQKEKVLKDLTIVTDLKTMTW